MCAIMPHTIDLLYTRNQFLGYISAIVFNTARVYPKTGFWSYLEFIRRSLVYIHRLIHNNLSICTSRLFFMYLSLLEHTNYTVGQYIFIILKKPTPDWPKFLNFPKKSTRPAQICTFLSWPIPIIFEFLRNLLIFVFMLLSRTYMCI